MGRPEELFHLVCTLRYPCEGFCLHSGCILWVPAFSLQSLPVLLAHADTMPRPFLCQTAGQPGGDWKFHLGLGSTNMICRQLQQGPHSWGTMSPMVGTPPGASALKFPLELSTLWRSSSVGSVTDVVQDSPLLPAPARNTCLMSPHCLKNQPLWSPLGASPLHLWTHLPYIAPALPTYPCLQTDLGPATLKLVGN